MVDYVPASADADDALREDVLTRLGALASDPAKAAAFANGLILDGTAHRLRIMSGLQQFMTLPEAETKRLVRARMAQLIAQTVAGTGCITRDDLIAGGFSPDEIAEHFNEAKRAARVAGMAV